MADSAAEVKEFMKKKDAMEAEIKELLDVLESQKGVGMNEPVVDEEQYPRADIDINTVRNARQRVICLQNDHKEIMKQIEEGLHKIHAENRSEPEGSQSQTTSEASAPSAVRRDSVVAFAKVDRVDAGSPAALGGIQEGDLLLRFGSVTSKNFQTLQNIGTVVTHGKGRALPVTVSRNGQEMHMAVTPRLWSGKGLLGCNIVPL